MKIQSEEAANKALSEHKILRETKKTKPPLTVQEMQKQLKENKPAASAKTKKYMGGGLVKGKGRKRII